MAHELDKIRLTGLEYLKSAFGEKAVERAVSLAGAFEVEVPGWMFWNGFGGGGRFDSGSGGGAARDCGEIAEDAGLVHMLTGSAPLVGMHVLWFFSNDGITVDQMLAVDAAAKLEAHGVAMGSISPTYFLDGSEDGSFTSQDKDTRQRYIDQTVMAVGIANGLASGVATLWFPDGTNYPGQRGLREKISMLRDGLEEFWEMTPQQVRNEMDKVLVEYKLFEPGTYSTTVPDWGTARELAGVFGNKGGVLVDLGHHPHGTNIEQIVSSLLAFGSGGGLHFNTRYAADDDHSVQADYQMACILAELISAGALGNPDRSLNWYYGLDQMARTEQRIPSVLKSIDALKRSVARAALLDIEALNEHQRSCDLIAANEEFERAMLHADTTPVVMESLVRAGLHPVPLTAYRESGYQERIEKQRSE
jgi:L-rhamnose isomerase/sugar isomerase